MCYAGLKKSTHTLVFMSKIRGRASWFRHVRPTGQVIFSVSIDINYSDFTSLPKKPSNTEIDITFRLISNKK